MCNLCEFLLIGVGAIENAWWMFFIGKLLLADVNKENSNSHRTPCWEGRKLHLLDEEGLALQRLEHACILWTLLLKTETLG